MLPNSQKICDSGHEVRSGSLLDEKIGLLFYLLNDNLFLNPNNAFRKPQRPQRKILKVKEILSYSSLCSHNLFFSVTATLLLNKRVHREK